MNDQVTYMIPSAAELQHAGGRRLERTKGPTMRRMLRAGTAVATAAAMLAVVAAGGAYAAAGGGGTITICVHHRGGGLYRSRGGCARHDSKLSWNAAGRQVSAGAQGPQGRAGAQGPQGAAGGGGGRGDPRSACDPVLRSDHVRRHRQRFRVAGQRRSLRYRRLSRELRDRCHALHCARQSGRGPGVLVAWSRHRRCQRIRPARQHQHRRRHSLGARISQRRHRERCDLQRIDGE